MIVKLPYQKLKRKTRLLEKTTIFFLHIFTKQHLPGKRPGLGLARTIPAATSTVLT